MAKAETEVEAESKKKVFNGWLVVVLILILVVAGIYYAVYYRKHRYSVEKLKNQEGNFSYLKSNNEKLVVKVHGLEKYINEIKNDVKEIAKLDETCQKEKIREFYSNLHHNSSTLLDKSENHLELVNDLNVDFFNKIQKRHPQLNKSEVIICYYLFIGFKNKEIAVFLNTSVRAIESKRYRISKKIEYTRNDITLIEHLKETFKDARANN
jgi:DNA-binding CsgD family transcriptional regulator